MLNCKDRREEILAIIEKNKHMSVEDLCSFFKVNEQVIYRDLIYLEKINKIKRASKGAIFPESKAKRNSLNLSYRETIFFKEKKELSVVDDQTGCPTYAKDLAEVILKIINSQSKKFGIYHYSNQGEITWYDLAKEIFKQSNADINLYKTDSNTFKTLATRPKYSVLNTSKIHSLLKLEPIQWKKSLEKCLKEIK